MAEREQRRTNWRALRSGVRVTLTSSAIIFGITYAARTFLFDGVLRLLAGDVSLPGPATVGLGSVALGMAFGFAAMRRSRAYVQGPDEQHDGAGTGGPEHGAADVGGRAPEAGFVGQRWLGSVAASRAAHAGPVVNPDE